jgi:hypothetical protein
MIGLVDDMRAQTALPYRSLCRVMKIPYGNLMRWRGRLQKEQQVVDVPGPRRIPVASLPSLSQGLSTLVHCRSRTRGSGMLYERYRGLVSRQAIRCAIKQARRQAHHQLRASLKHIHWLVPGSVWSMDMFEYDRDGEGKRVFIHQVQDLASRYKLPPIGGVYPCGEEIAAHLQALFNEHGVPLFIKRDNGRNYNHAAIDDVLAENLVLPLNSPCEYPKYNGGIEHAQGELKQRIRLKIQAAGGSFLRKNIEPYAQASAHDLNHLPRQILLGKTACQSFHGARRIKFNRMERRDIYDCVNRLKYDILRSMNDQSTNNAETAWRLAASHWLQTNGFFIVSVNGKVSPTFTTFLDS